MMHSNELEFFILSLMLEVVKSAYHQHSSLLSVVCGRQCRNEDMKIKNIVFIETQNGKYLTIVNLKFKFPNSHIMHMRVKLMKLV
jgi:hypothetical protein